MRKHTITQAYEFTAHVEVEVPEDWTEEEVKEYFTDFPLAVTIFSEFPEDDEAKISGLILDGVTTVGEPQLDALV